MWPTIIVVGKRGVVVHESRIKCYSTRCVFTSEAGLFALYPKTRQPLSIVWLVDCVRQYVRFYIFFREEKEKRNKGEMSIEKKEKETERKRDRERERLTG